ncbi:Homoserine dehydrogenase [Metarhizium acridum]|uniref:Homoserine dehydrogenase n=1 Tax=Metarhizium acridum (strain CQMa 102) TaxID=655827 RepID=E9EDZ3_METAQ|nr:homoserine dehydrogenase [Metarhizium acridum CQMa 102]EFY85885.1 homoserine dehydrogenase [Metarhizium acridum CQMa 102]KAG8405595.1 Homoserine dehydrogenase [Metarhizium acridum]KAG8423534.1 Homoserine dehydrogenase [Metarhizium acridum]
MASASTIFIAVIGAGGVGKCFLTQLRDLAVRRPSPKLSLCYISTSRRALYNDDYSAINLDNAIDVLAASSKAPPTLTDLVAYLSKAPGKAIIVDNTSSQEVAETYPTALKLGVSIVTPNKKAFSGSYQLWQDIFQASAASGAKVYHESSVGAGLPVISTLKDLVETGDEVTKIEGVFSGTMSFLFNSFAPVIGSGGKWSEEVKKAKALGYTEPDPRDDLNGLDVARKLTILARLAGLPVESPTSFPVESLIPKELESCSSGDEFMEKLPSFDQQMEEKKASAGDKVIRFVGSIDVGAKDVKVGLQTFDPSHPIAALKGSDNIISFYTKRYGNNPLIVQGAGAGGDVTAMGVTADLIKVIGQLA